MSIEAKKNVSFILITLTILLSYQNCAPVRFSQGEKTSANPEVKPAGNPTDTSPTQPAPQTTTTQGGTPIQPVKKQSISYYYEEALTQTIITSSILSLSSNRSIIFHSGYQYFPSIVKPSLKGTCMQNATCTNSEYFQLWNSLLNIYDTSIDSNGYKNGNTDSPTYQLNCSDPIESFLCKGIIKAADIKAAKKSQCAPKSVQITPLMRTELETRYDKSYAGIYSTLSIDKDCLCVYDGVYTDPSFSGEIFHMKSPALDSHCASNFSEYQ